MYTNLYIIDFNDSFTYNISSDIYESFPSHKVLNYRDFFKKEFYQVIDTDKKIVLILGPGPGHPSDYSDCFVQLLKVLNKPNIFIMGICLGHQILASILEYKIIDSKEKVHGESVSIFYNNTNLKVQRYNSLVPRKEGRSIEVFSIEDEVYILKDANFISFQFHPESIGTERDIDFYSEIKHFLGK